MVFRCKGSIFPVYAEFDRSRMNGATYDLSVMNGNIFRKITPIFNPVLSVKLICQNWDLLVQLVQRNIHARYRGSLFGLLWSFIQPLLMLCIYTFVFGVIFQLRWGGPVDSKSAFAVVMLCGMSIFQIFSESVNGSCRIIVGNRNYVKKVKFPLEILPVSQVFSALILGSAWFILILLGVVFILGSLNWTVLLLPLTLIPLLLLALGCSWFVASLGVYVRDTPYCVTVILQMLYFMTPIFYPTSAVPEGFRWLHRINPLALIVEETRRILLYGQLPNWKALVLAMVAGIVAAQLGLLWFIRTKRGFADVI